MALPFPGASPLAGPARPRPSGVRQPLQRCGSVHGMCPGCARRSDPLQGQCKPVRGCGRVWKGVGGCPRRSLPGAGQRHARLRVPGNNLSAKSRVQHWTIAGEEGGAPREGSNGRGHQGETRTSLSAPARGGGGARSRSSLRGGSGWFRRRLVRPLLHRRGFRVMGNVTANVSRKFYGRGKSCSTTAEVDSMPIKAPVNAMFPPRTLP